MSFLYIYCNEKIKLLTLLIYILITLFTLKNVTEVHFREFLTSIRRRVSIFVFIRVTFVNLR